MLNLILLTFSQIQNEPTQWVYVPSDYSASATLVTEIASNLDSSIYFNDNIDSFVAFDSANNVRGVASRLSPPCTEVFCLYPRPIWQLLIGGGTSPSDVPYGTEITFRYYDASENKIYDLENTYTWSLNAAVGAPGSPQPYTAIVPPPSPPPPLPSSPPSPFPPPPLPPIPHTI